jgi:hypothetical protein
MKRIVPILIAVAAAMAALTGCGGQSKANVNAAVCQEFWAQAGTNAKQFLPDADRITLKHWQAKDYNDMALDPANRRFRCKAMPASALPRPDAYGVPS